jgi:hypothetical protein
MIEGRIKSLDNIDINILGNIIKNKLKPDRTLMGIFHKLLKAGYMKYPNPDLRSDYGLPEVGRKLGARRISPKAEGLPEWFTLPPLYIMMSAAGVGGLLLNIYLTSLDEFIDKLKENYARGPVPRRIYYVRYADEWVIGVEGPFQLAKKIKEDILTFLWEELKLEQEKTKITHLGIKYAKFLGHYLGWPSFGQPSEVKTLVRSTLRSGASLFTDDPGLLLSKVSFAPSILIPFNDLKSKLIEKGFADKSGHPKFIGKFLFLSDYEIVKKYNSVLIRIMTFYNMADNRSGLGELLYILEYSLAHTLAAKHRSTLAKIFNKYGKPISVASSDSDKIKFAKPSSLKAEYLNNKYGKLSTEEG